MSNRLLAVVVLVVLVAGVLLVCAGESSSVLAQSDPETTLEPGDYVRQLRHDDRLRTYVLHVPPLYDASQPVAVVFSFHGGGGNAEHQRAMSDFAALADQEGFLVVTPNGSGRLPNMLLTWNGGTCCAYAREHEVDDVGFFRAMVADLAGVVNLDMTRIYATGLSNGAIMSYRLACEASDLVAAIGPVAATLNYPACEPAHPVPVVHFHGLLDENVPYEGGYGAGIEDEVWFTSVPDTVAFWVAHNGCQTTPVIEEGGHIRHEVYAGCAQDATVELYTITDGGHAWPGGNPSRRPGADEPTTEISATAVMWDFFTQHTRTTTASPLPDGVSE